MTGSVETFQLSVEAAEVYEARFVPAIFGEWAPHLVEAAGVAPGQAVLDVACGTGVVARTAADRMGGRGRVVGLDLNEGMLAVAGRLRPDIEWRQGDAAELPFEAGSFDAVLCQSALMFFPDRAGALREMARVATPGGTVAVQVWDRLEAQEGFGAIYAAFVGAPRPRGDGAGELLLGPGRPRPGWLAVRGRRHAGHRAPGPASAPSGTTRPKRPSRPSSRRPRWPGGSARRPTAACSEAASEAMRPFTVAGGRVELPIRGHLITAAKAA